MIGKNWSWRRWRRNWSFPSDLNVPAKVRVAEKAKWTVAAAWTGDLPPRTPLLPEQRIALERTDVIQDLSAVAGPDDASRMIVATPKKAK
jgi:hypothetical protein